MKKVLMMVLISALVFSSFAVSAFADSPSKSVEQNGTPDISSVAVVDKDGNVVKDLSNEDVEIAPVSPKTRSAVDICPDVAGNLPKGVDAKNVVITDIFSLSPNEKAIEYLKTDGNKVAVKLKLGYTPLAVLYKVEGGDWQLLPANCFKIDGDYVTVMIDAAAELAFVREGTGTAGDSGQNVTDGGAKTSPQTGESNLPVVFGMLIMAAGAGCIALRKRA